MVSKEFLADNLNTPNLFDGRIVARRRAGQFFLYDVQSHGALVGVSIRALLGVSLVVAYESTAISKDVIYAGSPGMCTRCIAALLFWSCLGLRGQWTSHNGLNIAFDQIDVP